MKTRTSNQCPSTTPATAATSGAMPARLSGLLPRCVARTARTVSRSLAACWASERGASALEYAIVFPMFFAVFWGTFQFGVIYTTQSLLDNATRDAARLIRIGTLSGNSSSYSSALTTAVCNDLTISSYSLVPNCSSNIQIYLAAATSGSPTGAGFTTLSAATISSGTMTQTKAYVYSKYDVILEVGYKMPWVSLFFSSNDMLVSTQAFQTEPY